MWRSVFAPCLLGLASVLELAGCASTGGLEAEMSKMRRDLVQMKKDLQETQATVQRLEGQVTLLSLDQRTGVGQAPPTAVAGGGAVAGPEGRDGARLTERARSTRARAPSTPVRRVAAAERGKVLPVVRLGAKAEVIASEDSVQDMGAQDDGSPPVVIQMRGDDRGDDLGSEDRLPVDHEVLKHPDPVLGKHAPVSSPSSPSSPSSRGAVRAAEATSAEIEAEYAAALAKLRAEQKPAEALVLFEQFAAKHPKANLTANAIYWSAECRFQSGAYKEAIEGFSKLVRDRPRSAKVPDALLRTGEAWLALHEQGKAEPLFKQVIEVYPKSEAAGRAKTTLDSLASR